MLLAACQRQAPAAPSAPEASRATPAPQGWDRLVEAARREGTLSLYGPAGGNYRAALVDAFERAYPGIKVQGTFGPVTDLVSRVTTERTANRYIPDIFIGGTGPSLVTLKPAGALAPLQPALVSPEVLDVSGWLEQRLWWADAAEPYTTLSFGGAVLSPVAYNTGMVNPQQFTSYWDVLDPKWKGKLAATDLGNPGPGAVHARFMYKHPQLGPPYFQRLFAEMDVTLSGDQRQLIDWIAQGRFPLGVLLSNTDVSRAAEQGLPIALVPAEQFREGTVVAPGWAALNLVDRAPHPEAAKLYANWLLSREGQIAWQQVTRETSLRTDIPKEGLYPALTPKPGIKYADGGAEEYAGMPPSIFRDLIAAAQQPARP